MWADIDMGEEVVVHKCVVGLRVGEGDADVFILLYCQNW